MKSQTGVFHWLPRIICILAIMFISMFAMDAFTPGLTMGQQLSDFAMHLIPSFILLALLIVAWKWELIGGTIFALIGLALSPLVYMHNYEINHSVGMSLGIIAMITLPFFGVGILFIISYNKKKSEQKTK